MTFSTHTFATLGMTPGTYVWTWPSGTVTLVIVPPAAVPISSPIGLALLMMLALIGLAVLHRRQPG